MVHHGQIVNLDGMENHLQIIFHQVLAVIQLFRQLNALGDIFQALVKGAGKQVIPADQELHLHAQGVGLGGVLVQGADLLGQGHQLVLTAQARKGEVRLRRAGQHGGVDFVLYRVEGPHILQPVGISLIHILTATEMVNQHRAQSHVSGG